MNADRTGLNRVRLLSSLAVAVLMSAMMVTNSQAHTRVRVGPNGCKVIYNWRFPPCAGNVEMFGPSPLPFQAPTRVHSPQLDGCPAPPADATAWTAQSGGCDAAGNVSSYAITHGNSRAGDSRLRTSAFRTDTLFATDSVRFRVNRSGTIVTLNNFSGELRVNREPSASRYAVLVYPSEAAADADVGDTGAGAVFHGVIVLRHGKVLQALRGFSGADFVVNNNPDGSVTATPAPGLSKAVAVPDANTATVVVISDPGTDADGALPGTSPLGLALLSLLMLGGGVWFVSRRTRTQMA